MGSAASTLSPRADTLQSSYITLITDTCARDAQFKASLLASLGAPGGTTVQEHVQATDTAAFTDEGDGLSYRMKAETTDGRQMSLWHDVPLKHKDSDGKETGYLNFVCEVSFLVARASEFENARRTKTRALCSLRRECYYERPT